MEKKPYWCYSDSKDQADTVLDLDSATNIKPAERNPPLFIVPRSVFHRSVRYNIEITPVESVDGASIEVSVHGLDAGSIAVRAMITSDIAAILHGLEKTLSS